jgi:hypothetical protein
VQKNISVNNYFATKSNNIFGLDNKLFRILRTRECIRKKRRRIKPNTIVLHLLFCIILFFVIIPLY